MKHHDEVGKEEFESENLTEQKEQYRGPTTNSRAKLVKSVKFREQLGSIRLQIAETDLFGRPSAINQVGQKLSAAMLASWCRDASFRNYFPILVS